MKLKISNVFALFFLSSFFYGCGSKDAYSYRTKEFNRPNKPIATVEKAWVARHKYDHERRLLIPMVGGTRWGAVQEYKEDGTLEYKDWWVRDVKMEDLQASPSKTLIIPKTRKLNSQASLEGINLEGVTRPSSAESIQGTDGGSTIPGEVLPPQDAFTIENSDSPVSETPFAPLPFDSLPSLPEENNLDSASPFAPLPDAFPPLTP
jgi:hypothetical protein